MNIQALYSKFPTQEDCISYLEKIYWPNGPICPYCGSTRKICYVRKIARYHCTLCNVNFTVTTQTVFNRTRVPLQKWFIAIIIKSRGKISARKLAKILGVNKNTTWLMSENIRLAMMDKDNRDLILTIIQLEDEIEEQNESREKN